MKSNFLLMLTLTLSQSLFAQEISAEGPFDQLIIRGVTLINGNGAPPIGPVESRLKKMLSLRYL